MTNTIKLIRCIKCGHNLIGNNVKPNIIMPTHYCSRCNKYYTIVIKEDEKDKV